MAALILVLSGCMTHATVSRDALRYPAAVGPGEPPVLAAVDDAGREQIVEVRPDLRVTIRLARGAIEARARDLLLAEDALVVARGGGDRRIPWARVRGAEISEPRPWLAFAIALGAGTLAGGALLLAESDL